MKVLCVIPRVTKGENDFYELPLGMLYIATVIKSEGYDPVILDLNNNFQESEAEAISKAIRSYAVDVLLVGGLSAFFCSIERILRAAKESAPGIITILGGGVVSSDRDLICPELSPDYAVIGEGEATVVDLLDALETGKHPSTVLGIGWRSDDGTYIFNPERPAIEDIDALPFPDYNMLDMERYFRRQTPISPAYYYPLDFPRALPIITSRSCPLNCTFCFHPIGKKYRARSLDNVFLEIEAMIAQYDVKILSVMDEMMSSNKARLIEFAERIKVYNILWSTQLWTSSVDSETLQVMRDSGCYLISYGLESISDTVLKSMKKFSTNKENIESSLALTAGEGITIQGNFIFGDPAETVATCDETLSWWQEHKEYQINLGRIAPYPGTQLYRDALEKGLISDPLSFVRQGSPTVNLMQMNAAEYTELMGKIARAVSEGRFFCTIQDVRVDSRTEDERYFCDIECPHCREVMTYGNMFVEKPAIFKLGCRNCGLRFDVNPAPFPNLQARLEQQRKKILGLLEKHGSFVVSPAVFEYAFTDYLTLVGIDDRDLNISCVLDSNSSRVGELFLGRYPIQLRDALEDGAWDGAAVLVMPSIYRIDIINEFIALGVPQERIFSVEDI